MVSLLKTDLDGAGIVIAKIQNSGPIQELQWVSSRPQGRVFREVRELLGDGLLPSVVDGVGKPHQVSLQEQIKAAFRRHRLKEPGR